MGCKKLSYHEKNVSPLKVIWSESHTNKARQESKINTNFFELDYYAFGSLMPGRSYSSNSYRYGYNKGSEKDDEITGVTGANITTMFREYDTRLGKTWSIDPQAAKMPWQSPYSSMDNNPIWFNDPFGDIVDYKKFRDRVNVGAKRLFSKSFRADFNAKRDDKVNTFTYDKVASAPTLGDATATWSGTPYTAQQFDVNYSNNGSPITTEDKSVDIDLRGRKPVTEKYTIDPIGATKYPSSQTFNVDNPVQGGDIKFDAAEYPDIFNVTNGGTNVHSESVVDYGQFKFKNVDTYGTGSYTVPAGTTQLQVSVSTRANWPSGKNENPSVGNIKYEKYRFPALKATLNFKTIHFK